MKKKLFIEFCVLTICFLTIWFGFRYLLINNIISNSINIPREKEEKLGEYLAAGFKTGNQEIKDVIVKDAVEKILIRLLKGLGETNYQYKIIVLKNPQINALTLPGGYIIVYSGLLNFSDSPEELAVVLAHEIGHTEKNHVMNKLIKSIGLNSLFVILSALDEMMISEIIETLISSFYERGQEKEADEFALELLEVSNIDPRHAAVFFRKLNSFNSEKQEGFTGKLDIFKTHPNYIYRIHNALSFKLSNKFKAQPFEINWEDVIQNIY